MMLTTMNIDQNTSSGPDTNADGTVDASMAVARVWANNTHPSRIGAHAGGYRLAYAPRSRDGVHGPNLIRNGSADYDGNLENWTLGTTGSHGGQSWSATPPVSTGPSFLCVEGRTSNVCTFVAGSAGAFIETSEKIAVTPGETYVLSGFASFRNANDKVCLTSDADRDGVFACDASMSDTITGTEVANNFTAWQHPYWSSWVIPAGVHHVGVRLELGGSNTMTFDGFSLRRLTTYQSDSWQSDERVGSSFLLNDPGDRCILVTGDSWSAKGSAPGDNFRIGLADGLARRYPHKTSAQWQSQIVLSGVGGYKASDVLANWTSMVSKYDCLYGVFHVGTNELATSVPQATWLANTKEIAQRARNEGLIPIFVSPSPLGPTGATLMTTAGEFVDAQRNEFLAGVGDRGAAVTSSGMVRRFAQTATVTVANTTTETTLVGAGAGSMVIPQGWLYAGSTIEVEARGYYSALALADPRIRVKLGSTAFCDAGATIDVAAATNRTWSMSCTITTRAAPGSSVATIGQGLAHYMTDSTTTHASVANTATSNVATNANITADVTVQWDAASASNTLTLTTLVLRIVN
jgi:hypothetical protein